MNGKSHRRTTRIAFSISGNGGASDKSRIIDESAEVDNYRDLEFVDVESAMAWLTGGHGRDDPHRSSSSDDDDHARYEFEGHIYTAFNHFIDIKKGTGRFDDYDGYSYKRGSASNGEYQDADDAKKDWKITLLTSLTGHKKVDDALNYWFNDEYVHAPGQRWYRGCSPAVERYSYPAGLGSYNSVDAELVARFPLAEWKGGSNRGIPYSVFMPVDNLARYWYDLVLFGNYRLGLGGVMHAIQDASVPHHAAATNGNWHSRYENELEAELEDWTCSCTGFQSRAEELYQKWMQSDTTQPDRLTLADWNLVPSAGWRIDYLVTWVALNAYRAYDRKYRHFRSGYRFDGCSAQELAQIAAAMSALALAKVIQDKGKLMLIGLADREAFRKLYGVPVSLRSLSQPDRFVRHADANGKVDASSSVQNSLDATFKVVWGLDDPNSGMSLESVRYPGRYLRHNGYQMRAEEDDDSQSFKASATFQLQPGLANRMWSSIRSTDRAGHYICQRDGRLYLDSVAGKTGGSLVQFLRDATFLLRQPW